MDRRVELLAPAGNQQGFYGAIHAGADAVYLGGERFSARAYADNFTSEELIACIRYAHIWGRKVYLTVNTLIKETELEELYPYLKPLYEAGLDGVIVQDIGAFSFIREYFPDMELHVSTQMTLTGKYGAGLLKKMGAVRIVPARELSLAEIAELKTATGLQVETFIHGAMCYCYSGQCLFSSILGGRSGNRGRCAQPCRLPYRVEHGGRIGGECYPLSLKDMCTIEHIPELIAAGIDSFKIEGRMKKPEYAAGVTAVYRRYIDRYYHGEDCSVTEEDMEILSKLYIRSERQSGYYYRHNGRNMVTLEDPSYSSGDDKLMEEIRSRYLTDRPRRKIGIHAVFRIGIPARVILTLDGFQVSVEGGTVSAALNQPVTVENVRRQLGKLGDTIFFTERPDIELDEGAFYPLKAINELRRQAVAKLEELLIRENGFPVSRECVQTPVHADIISSVREAVNGSFHVLLRTGNQLNALAEVLSNDCGGADISSLRRVYLEAGLFQQAFDAGDSQLQEQIRLLHSHGCELVIALPAIIRSRDEHFLRSIRKLYSQNYDWIQGFLVRSMDGLGFLEEIKAKESRKPAVYADAGLYIWNHESVDCLRRSGSCVSAGETGGTDTLPLLDGFCLPYELRASEQRRLLERLNVPCEKVVYGRIPLMITANCVVNTVEGCNGGAEIGFLIDRYKKRFPVLRDCGHCINIIYNSLPLSLHTELSKWSKAVDYRLDFTIEDGGETTAILRYFLSGARGESPCAEYTTGHEKRGVQ